MNASFSSAISILCGAESARKEDCHRVCELLSLDPTSTIARILIEKEQRFVVFNITLLEKVAKVVEDHKIKRSITDWPFEHFWGNPYEPRHSKLLGYFIDPEAAHECGHFLLGKLLSILDKSLTASERLPPVLSRFPEGGCRVNAEDQYIDLCIERDCDDRKYAIIIENKINWAENKHKQLQTYVERVRCGRGFEYNQIYVFYLPLTDAKNPNKDDLAWLDEKKVCYKKITFKDHILGWLNAVLAESERGWPPNMAEGMRENLSHYRNLIGYLINKQKELTMNHAILKQLEQSEKENPLPTWSQVESLQKSAVELKQCLESVLRGKLLLSIRSNLQEKGGDVWLCRDPDSTIKIKVGSPYEDDFGGDVDFCVSADDSVIVCFGCGPNGFWMGYMRGDSRDKQDKSERFVILEAQKLLKSTIGKPAPWYAWEYMKGVNYDNCLAQSSTITETLLEMRNGVVDQLKKKGVRS